MKWLNKHQGLLTLIAFLIFGIWNLYVTFATNIREENDVTKKATDMTAKLEERVSRAQTDIEKTNTTIEKFEAKISEIDKHVAVIEDRLKQATIKSLIAAGVSSKQALEFWGSKSILRVFPFKIPQEEKQPGNPSFKFEQNR